MKLYTELKGYHIIIADDHDFARQGAMNALKNFGMNVSVCASYIELWNILIKSHISFHAAIVDLSGMGETFDARRDIPALVHQFQQTKIIIWTLHPYIARRLCVEDDVAGYVHKDDQIEGLLSALQEVLINKGLYYSHAIRAYPQEVLSFRERDVLSLSARGFTVQQIALKLSISIATVNEHQKRIRAKLGADNIAHAVFLASTNGIIR